VAGYPSDANLTDHSVIHVLSTNSLLMQRKLLHLCWFSMPQPNMLPQNIMHINA